MSGGDGGAPTPRRRDFEEGEGLEALEPLRVREPADFDAFLRAMSRTSFGGRALGEAADVVTAMARDDGCRVVGTFSGALTPAKMGPLIGEMADAGILDAVVVTGAIATHGLIEEIGHHHYKCPRGADDRELYEAGYDRIHDTLELEASFDRLHGIVDGLLDALPPGERWGSVELMARFGEWLDAHGSHGGFVHACWRNGVPVYIPAFTDCELGLDVAVHDAERRREGREEAGRSYDAFRDLDHLVELLAGAPTIGIFTVGGGVPRNWAQQFGPYTEILERRLGAGEFSFNRFAYAVRICPEPDHWGGLSGCGYSEGVSWGKFDPPGEGGAYAEVKADATIAWPILLRAVLERLDAGEDG